MVNIKDAIDIAYRVSDKTDRFWNFFVVVHFVVVGWLVSIESNMNTRYRIVISVIYLSCVLINYFALVKQYGIFHCIMVEIREHAKGDHFKTIEMNELLKGLKFPKRVHLINIVYVVFIILVMYTIWR